MLDILALYLIVECVMPPWLWPLQRHILAPLWDQLPLDRWPGVIALVTLGVRKISVLFFFRVLPSHTVGLCNHTHTISMNESGRAPILSTISTTFSRTSRGLSKRSPWPSPYSAQPLLRIQTCPPTVHTPTMWPKKFHSDASRSTARTCAYISFEGKLIRIYT